MAHSCGRALAGCAVNLLWRRPELPACRQGLTGVARCCAGACVPQENDMLQRQNELLRSSEAAYQREAQLVSADSNNAPMLP